MQLFFSFILVVTANYYFGNFDNYIEKISGTDISINMIAVKGGSFVLGNEQTTQYDADEFPLKKIVISDFWMAETETTYDLFQLFLDESKDPAPKVDAITRPSQPYIDFTQGMGKNGGYPANSMQQYSAIMFCKWLYKKTGNFYRLPTEAEWEYVCKLSYQNIDTFEFKNFDWYSSNSGGTYHPVAKLKPSSLGFYDLLGNVGEWTLDQYKSDYYSTLQDGTKDPLAKKEKRYPCSVRGGNYKSSLTDLRPENRTQSDPTWNRRDPQVPKSKWWNADAPFIGFRIVRPNQKTSKKEIDLFFENHLK